MKVKGAEELGKWWEILGLGNIGEMGGFKDLGVQLFWTMGVHPKLEGLGVGDK